MEHNNLQKADLLKYTRIIQQKAMLTNLGTD